MSPRAVISRHPETIATDIDGDVVLMSLVSGRTFGLDQRGGRIWTLLEQPQPLEHLVAELLKVYDTTREQCQEDVAEFLAKLAEVQLVVIAEPAATP
jgi:hypothetical protein